MGNETNGFKVAIITILIIIGILIFAVFVWPTAWRYSSYGSSRIPIRENRFTGKVERFYPSTGWVEIEPYTPKPVTEN